MGLGLDNILFYRIKRPDIGEKMICSRDKRLWLEIGEGLRRRALRVELEGPSSRDRARGAKFETKGMISFFILLPLVFS